MFGNFLTIFGPKIEQFDVLWLMNCLTSLTPSPELHLRLLKHALFDPILSVSTLGLCLRHYSPLRNVTRLIAWIFTSLLAMDWMVSAWIPVFGFYLKLWLHAIITWLSAVVSPLGNTPLFTYCATHPFWIAWIFTSLPAMDWMVSAWIPVFDFNLTGNEPLLPYHIYYILYSKRLEPIVRLWITC